ncbi:LacI family DNA-binding transcriptional regulator [Spelaeicoccus albus]|uniref:DNA-binding LacI/PurR family transcriptional regulator n=2 Tax=Spelaeicoccus albus TaxID=1280376 RepID=A0A7Z0D1R0_9MICO|nr:LacI family DNA-binding transcriptional regulator [Spelaeicoccus albus]NYI66672.1 DNA-binding LacI/PurR family transcriptional regulator [Spelaeicoccus albus]
MAGSITVRDVAKAAGVSASTVSRALAANSVVAAETRERIINVARQLGYRPNHAARGLITGRTHNIGLVIPDLENPYFASVTKGVQSRALTEGYSVFIADSDEDARAELELVRKLSKQVDGLILCSARMSDADIASVADDTTMVLINREWGDLTSVVVDDSEIIRQALEHLYALGHRHIAYAGGPSTSWSNRKRWAGIEAVQPKLEGLTISPLGSFAPVFGGGQSAADVAVASGATAVLAYNDLMGLGILARLATRGIDVPGDMSVMGIDDVNVATLVSPGLTTVRSPLTKIGRSAVNALIDLIEPTDRHNSIEDLPVQLVVRQSTSVPRSR